MSLAGTKVGKIRIVEQLGAGGMGEIYLGYDEKLERNVAIKAIRAEKRLDPQAKIRFMREAKALSKLEHPHICRIYDFLEGESHDFLIMELISGKSLDKMQGLTRKAKLRIAEQIAEVLTAAHAENIVHRDLKPENIMITDAGVKVLDFGLAHIIGEKPIAAATSNREALDANDAELEGTLDSYHTELGTIVGTPRFMSPEQARGERTTAASDIYTFGLLLQWLLTDRSPYDPKFQHTALLKEVMQGRSLPVEGLSSDLTALINNLKSLAPERRPVAVEVLKQIKWIRQKPARTLRRTVVAAFALLLIIASVVSTLGFVRAKRSEKRAIASEARAVHEAEMAEQTVALLQEFLGSVDPGEQGKDITVIELVEAFKPRLEELNDQPLIQASLFTTYGRTYKGLGLYDEVYFYYQRAFEIRKQELGESHTKTLDASMNLANALKLQGKNNDAEHLYRQTLEAQQRVLGADHPNSLKTSMNLANVVLNQGDYLESERLFLLTLKAQKRVLGDEDPETLSSLMNLASAVLYQGKYAEAEQLYRQCLEARTRVLGAEHPETLKTTMNLALAVQSQGKNTEAAVLHRQTLQVRKKVLGDEHPFTLNSMANLATVLFNQGQYAEAEGLLIPCLSIRKRVLGEDHPHTLNALSNLAGTMNVQGKHVEAEKLQRQCYEARARVLGADHPQTLTSLSNLAANLDAQGKSQESERLTRQCLEARTRILGEEHPQTLASLNNLAAVMSSQGKNDEAEPLHRQCLAIRTRILGELHPKTLGSLNLLAITLKRLSQYEEAEGLHRRCLSAREQVLGERHPDTLWSMYNLACLESSRGNQDSAVAYLQKAVDHGFDQPTIATEPDLNPLHDHPQFKTILKAVNDNASKLN